jgi:hypothetical protein
MAPVMARSGREPKPPWRGVPAVVRGAVERGLGARVRRAQRAWGGYTPSPTYRLRLEDGRRAFLKAVGPDASELTREMFAAEERVYRELAAVVGPWSPGFLGGVEVGGWRGLLLADLGPKSAPPWHAGLVRAVARGYAAFHRSTLGRDLPGWVPDFEDFELHRRWNWAAEDEAIAASASLAGELAGQAGAWLRESRAALMGAASRIGRSRGEHAFLHLDARSDNLRVLGGRLYLFDWAWACAGPPENDLAALAISVASEGGPGVERVAGWYAEAFPVDEAELDAAVASLAGFFAGQAWLPERPGFPRLRSFQRTQLRVALPWAARRLGLAEPDWLVGVASEV